MSNIKQLVSKKIKGQQEIKFNAESDKGALILEDTSSNSAEDTLYLYLLSNGSRIKVKCLFRANSLREDYRIETLKFLKGEEYVLIGHQGHSDEPNKVGVFWE